MAMAYCHSPNPNLATFSEMTASADSAAATVATLRRGYGGGAATNVRMVLDKFSLRFVLDL